MTPQKRIPIVFNLYFITSQISFGHIYISVLVIYINSTIYIVKYVRSIIVTKVTKILSYLIFYTL